MDIAMVMNILEILIYVVLGGLVIWFKSNAKLRKAVADLINTAESMYTDTVKAGGKRFNWVVDSLHNLMPPVIRDIVPRSIIETIVQNVFDTMTDFAKKQLDEVVNKGTEEKY